MKLVRTGIVLLLLFGLQFPLSGQVLDGKLSTSFYGWERQDSVARGLQYLRGYENVQVNFGTGSISFHTYLQGSSDFQNEMSGDPRLKMFNTYVDVRGVAGLVDIRLGRQQVYAGVNYGTVDGVKLQVAPSSNVKLMLYGGGLAPADSRTDFFHNMDDNFQVGGQVLFRLSPRTHLSLSYMNRHRESKPYEAFRYDVNLGLVPTMIDYGSRANQYLSFSGDYATRELWLFGRVDYDFNFENLSRLELTSRYQVSSALGLVVEGYYRKSQIAYNSYFSLLERSSTGEFVIGADYAINENMNLLFRYSGVVYKEDFGMRVTTGLACRYLTFSYSKDLSYDGDLDGFSGRFRYPILDGKVVPNLGAAYSHYALADGIEKLSTLALSGGFTVRPWKMISLDVQGQYLTNRIYSSDMRLFARLNYWFANTFSSMKEGLQ